jgi:hypothetical protein
MMAHILEKQLPIDVFAQMVLKRCDLGIGSMLLGQEIQD